MINSTTFETLRPGDVIEVAHLQVNREYGRWTMTEVRSYHQAGDINPAYVTLLNGKSVTEPEVDTGAVRIKFVNRPSLAEC